MYSFSRRSDDQRRIIAALLSSVARLDCCCMIEFHASSLIVTYVDERCRVQKPSLVPSIVLLWVATV